MKKLAFVSVAVFLTGCTLFESQQPLPLYSLEAGHYAFTHEIPASLNITDPTAEASINTQRIALTPAPYHRDYLANGEWPERLPNIFKNILIQGLGQKWGVARVNSAGNGLSERYLLSSDVQDFSVHQIPGKPCEVRLHVTFKLLDLKERRVIAAETITETKVIKNFTMQDIVYTFNEATHALVDKISMWIEDSLAKSRDTNF